MILLFITDCCTFIHLTGTQIQNSSQQVLLPGVTAVINWADAAERANFSVFASIKEEASDLDQALDSSVDKEVKTQSVTLPLEVCCINQECLSDRNLRRSSLVFGLVYFDTCNSASFFFCCSVTLLTGHTAE